MAVGVTVKIEGLEDFARTMKSLGLSVEKELSEIIENAAQIVVDSAKAKVPVDTGELRDSIGNNKAEIKDHAAECIVGVDKEALHAHFIEFGTSKSAAQPFMRPAVKESKPAVDHQVSKDLRAILERARE